MRKRWLGMEYLFNIQWRRLPPEMPRAKKQFFEGSPSVSSSHLPSVRNLLINHALLALALHLTDLPEHVELCHSLVQLPGTRVLISHRAPGPLMQQEALGVPASCWDLGALPTCVCVCVCVWVTCLLQTQGEEGVKEVRGYLGMAGKVIGLPEFRSVGTPNASKS